MSSSNLPFVIFQTQHAGLSSQEMKLNLEERGVDNPGFFNLLGIRGAGTEPLENTKDFMENRNVACHGDTVMEQSLEQLLAQWEAPVGIRRIKAVHKNDVNYTDSKVVILKEFTDFYGVVTRIKQVLLVHSNTPVAFGEMLLRVTLLLRKLP
jgi:hypothetical protein